MYSHLLKAIFKKHYSRLVLFANKYVNEQADAEDIVQEAFSKFWIRRNSLLNQEENVIKGFLYQTVRNESLNHLKHQKIVQNHISQSEGEETQEPVLTHIIHAEIIAQIHSAIHELPEACRQVAQALFVEGKKYQEIAVELEISVNTVKSQRKRALQLLKPRLIDPAYLMLLNCFVEFTD